MLIIIHFVLPVAQPSDAQDNSNSSQLNVENDANSAENMMRRFRRNVHARAEFKKYARKIDIVIIHAALLIQMVFFAFLQSLRKCRCQ